MRVSIDHSEKTTGLFSKTTYYLVTLRVEFSQEELQVIKARKLEKDLVLERGIPADRKPSEFAGMEDIFNLRIGKLTREADTYAFATPLEAKAYDQELRNLMPQLKDYIMGNQEIAEKSSTFEL